MRKTSPGGRLLPVDTDTSTYSKRCRNSGLKGKSSKSKLPSLRRKDHPWTHGEIRWEKTSGKSPNPENKQQTFNPLKIPWLESMNIFFGRFGLFSGETVRFREIFPPGNDHISIKPAVIFESMIEFPPQLPPGGEMCFFSWEIWFFFY